MFRPALKRLAHYRVVGVGQRFFGNRPRIVPAVAVFVDQYSHKLGNAERRMRVVNVDRDLVRERFKASVVFDVLMDDALERRGNQKVLLF